jgi:CMP-2-keto-3-deoxyoctulosonic acid synthetase
MDAASMILQRSSGMSSVELSGKYLTNRLQRKKMAKTNPIDVVQEVLKEVVDDNFEALWVAASTTAMAAKKELKVDSESLTADASSESVDAVIGSALEEAGSEKLPSAVDKVSENPSRKQSSIRTCISTLAQLIRSDMVEELPRIKNLLSEKQDALSNYMDEISVASLKVSLEVCVYLLCHIMY